jgi:hypothetical protein
VVREPAESEHETLEAETAEGAVAGVLRLALGEQELE